MRNPIFNLGDHLKVSRGFYDHEGIYSGANRVIHFASPYSGAPKHLASIRETSLAEFALGGTITIETDTPTRAAPQEIVTRARSKLGRKGYDLFNSNCEHFASWCRTGRANSPQIEAALGIAAIVACVRYSQVGIAQTLKEIVGVALVASATKKLSRI